MPVQNFVASYEELLRFLQAYRDRLFYVALDVDPPPEGARAFDIVTFPDAIAEQVIRRVHRDVQPPRMTPDVRRRIDAAAIEQARLMCGVNIDPKNQYGLPGPELLRGAGWVRLVFNSRLYQRSLTDAFAFYDPIISGFREAGINVLLVLTHQTYGEGMGYVWPRMDSGSWATFTTQFVNVANQVAQHYGNEIDAYEIWNEPDVPNNPSSVYMPPADFAPLLRRTADAIRRNAPRADIVLGGLVGGTEIIRRYVASVRDALGGALPVDAIGLHPYGLGAPDDETVFSQFGSVQWALDRLAEVAPNVPVWLTEIGALGSNEARYWPQVAEYMRALFDYLRPQAHRVPVVIWYGWSDGMAFEAGANGLVTRAGQPKSPIYETFFNEACRE